MFGSHYSFMSDKVVTYDESSEATALGWIKQYVNAQWGGTEIHATLQAVCNVPVTEGKYTTSCRHVYVSHVFHVLHFA